MVSGDFSMDPIRLMYPDCTRKHLPFPVGVTVLGSCCYAHGFAPPINFLQM